MGADLSVALETERGNGWQTVSVAHQIYRGPHGDRIRDAGESCVTEGSEPESTHVSAIDPVRVAESTIDAIDQDDRPYWIRTYTAAQWIAFFAAHRGLPLAYEADDGDIDPPVFNPGIALLSTVAQLAYLVSEIGAERVRVVAWYGP